MRGCNRCCCALAIAVAATTFHALHAREVLLCAASRCVPAIAVAAIAVYALRA